MDKKFYELHVTVLPQKVVDFALYCKNIQAKPLYIQLDKGLHREQLMLAAQNMLLDDVSAKAWALDYERMVGQHFSVVRTKLESRLTEGPNEYYEAHWKLDFGIDPHYYDCKLQEFLLDKPHLLRSQNLFDPRIQYLSQRIYGSCEPLESSRKFNASGVAINFGGLQLVKTHYERCVYDSNPALDYGWA
jgi:hypothetical protein